MSYHRTDRLELLIVAAIICLSGCSTKSQPSTVARPTVQQYSQRINNMMNGGIAEVGDVAHPCREGMAGGAASMTSALPIYPHANQAGFGPADNNGGTATQFVSDDTFQSVYRWYKSRMPVDAETHFPATCNGAKVPQYMGPPQAMFTIGKPKDKDYRAIWILELPGDARMSGWPSGKPLPRTIILVMSRS